MSAWQCAAGWSRPNGGRRISSPSLQAQRLRALLAEAALVPYWRDLFAELAFDPQAVAGVQDLQALPLLDKATIRAHTDAMKHPRARSLARFNTGGSSGEPLIFFIGNERVSHDVAAKWRATRWWGVDIGDPEIVVWGSPIELGSQDRVRAWRDKAHAHRTAARVRDERRTSSTRSWPPSAEGGPGCCSVTRRR